MTDLRWRSAVCVVLLAGWFAPLAIAAFLSSGLNDLGPLGVVPGGWIWSLGVLAGAGAAVLAALITVWRCVTQAREA